MPFLLHAERMTTVTSHEVGLPFALETRAVTRPVFVRAARSPITNLRIEDARSFSASGVGSNIKTSPAATRGEAISSAAQKADGDNLMALSPAGSSQNCS
jgi:hypothetical protein